MNDIIDRPFARFLLFAVGYLSAVVASALVAATWFAVAGGQAGEMWPVMMIAGFYAMTAGAPGFLLALWLALRLRISSWIYFAVAGGLNAMLALTLVGWDVIFADVAGPSVAGGVAGGLAFWAVARCCGVLPGRPTAGA